MAKVTPITIGNIGGNPTSAANNINTNSTRFQSAIENTLSRDGSGPNQMEADFDLNHYDVLNGGIISADNIIVAGIDIVALLIALGLLPPGIPLPFLTWRQVAAALADTANPAGSNTYPLILSQVDPLMSDTASQQWESRSAVRTNDSVYQLIQTTTGWNGTQMNAFVTLARSKPL
jgi:hypothetical protein